LASAFACSSSTTTDDGGAPDGASDVQQQNDSSSNDTGTKDGSNDSAANDASDGSSNDASDAGAQFTLTVNNYLAWCKVTVNGGTPNTTAAQTYMLAANSSVTAVGDTKSSASFYWGYWGNVAADGGLADGGEDLSMTVDFTITRDMTLNACCPDNGQPLTQCTF
jgi:hypothetical protein